MNEMITLAALTQKGGSGKTTTALNLAVAGVLAGETVAAIDIDPQCSLSVWADIRASERPDEPDIDLSTVPPGRLSIAIKESRQRGATLTVIDSAPHSSEGILAAARQADLCIIPCRTSLLDLAAISTTLDICSVAGARVALLINATKSPRQHADLKAALGKLVDGVDRRYLCPVNLGDRTVYARSINDGKAVLEAEPNGKAAEEIIQLYQWVKELC